MNIEGLLLPRGGSSYAPSYLMIVFFLGKSKGFWQHQTHQKPLFLPFLGVFTVSNCIN